jgi:hypothetical protein
MEGIGAAGTVQTVKTRREEQEYDNNNNNNNNATHKPKEYISSKLVNLKLYYNNQIKWGKLYTEVLKDSQVIKFT